MGYCFMTIEKIKNRQQIVGKYLHNYRQIDVLNADPDKKHLNQELVSLNGKDYIQAFDERMQALGYGTDKKIRSNAVLGFEVVTTFSREDAEHMDLDKWKENNTKWLTETFNVDPEKYGNNVLSIVYHGDEPGNVHCHAFIVPIDGEGKLNARHFVQSRQKMIELQNSYGDLMKKEHNLNRGISGSKARHQDIKRFYAALNQALDKDLPQEKEGEKTEEYRKRVNDLYKDLSLKCYGLETKLKQLELSSQQEKINAVAAAKKEIYEELSKPAERMRELEHQFGTFEEIKESCRGFEDLLKGIEAQEPESKEDVINMINYLMEEGRKLKKKEKEKTETNR